MKHKIVIIGSTGKLGTKLLNFTKKNSIPIFGITCFSNKTKLLKQKKFFNVNKSYSLSELKDKHNFLKLLERKIHILYFLDFGSFSLLYLNHFLKYNKNSIIAVANKEMLIAGGSVLQDKIKKTKNIFMPLDSEHFSLLNSNIKSNNIKKIYITASGGPFYFNKSINLTNVSSKKVLSHPKWKMGTNNLIDSSNFINKFLEIFELSHIYNIPINKIDFLISKEAYVHSIIHYNDNSLSLNCFINNMIITLSKPLTYFYKIKQLPLKQNYLNLSNLKIEKPNDKRFRIFKYKKTLMKLTHSEQILLMIINNSAHKLYLSDNLKYDNIVTYIMTELFKHKKNIKLNSIKSILNFLDIKNNYYKSNV